jgi:hypothetical protein
VVPGLVGGVLAVFVWGVGVGQVVGQEVVDRGGTGGIASGSGEHVGTAGEGTARGGGSGSSTSATGFMVHPQGHIIQRPGEAS